MAIPESMQRFLSARCENIAYVETPIIAMDQQHGGALVCDTTRFWIYRT